MAKIRKISFCDVFGLKKLLSANGEDFLKYRRLFFTSVPSTYIQNLLYDLRLRVYPEIYTITDNSNNLKGAAVISRHKGNPYKRRIEHLFLEKNAYDEGRQLIGYISAKFGARGADTFYACIQNDRAEIISLLSKGCGFRICSSEELRSIPDACLTAEMSNLNFLPHFNSLRNFDNSDAQKAADLFNETLIPHYKYSLQKCREEFCTDFFSDICAASAFKYILPGSSETLTAYIEIKSNDNLNYFIDIIISPQHLELYPEIFFCAVKKIINRTKKFKLFIKNRKYLQSGSIAEKFFNENKFELIKDTTVLVRDFFKTVKEEQKPFNETGMVSGFEI